MLNLRATSALVLVVCVLAATIGLSSAASPEWRYCLAPSDKNKKMYISAAFSASGDAAYIDRMFRAALDRAGIEYDVVQCPRADTQNAIFDMMRDAVAFSKQIGYQPLYLGWEPED
jgi:hypothetical protein